MRAGFEQRIVIVLVHGTFAPKAPWTRPHSWFSEALLQAFARRSIGIPELTFIDWSGGNTHAARLEASGLLVAHLGDRNLGPDDACFIVGHSHGGNVALHAIVHNEAVRKQVDGVVTLATPFLLFRDEAPFVARVAAGLDASAFAALAWAFIPLISCILLVPVTLILHGLTDLKIAWINWLRRGIIGVCGSVFQNDTCRTVINGTAGVIDSGIAIFLILVMLGGGYFAVEEQQEQERKAAALRMAELSYLQPSDRLSKTPILAMSAPVDEALGILNTSWWAHRVTLWIMRIAVTGSLIMGTAGSIYALVLLSSYEQSLVGTDGFTVVSSSLLFVAKVAFVPLIFTAGAQVGAVLRLLTSLPALGFGSSEGRDNLFWTINALRNPEGAPLVQFRSYGLATLLQRGESFIHSRLYDSKQAVDDIAQFIAERLAGKVDGRR